MKILMVLDHEFPPDIRVENEIEALSEKGHQIHLACYSFSDTKRVEETKNVVIHRKKISKLIYKSSVGALKFPFYFNYWRKFLRKILKENNFDAIHIHDLPLAKVGYELAREYRLIFSLDLHENWPALLKVAKHTNTFLGRLLSSNKQWEKYELDYCRKADNIIVVVEEAKKRLTDLGIDKNKIYVVSNTLNFNHFELPPGNPDKKYFSMLYAGGINEHRGLQFVIKGLKHINSPDRKVRCWILGSGSYTESLMQLAREEKVEKQVIFTGWKSYAEMQKYFGRADICLIPHVKNEHTDSTIPHKLFQYMYAGKPVVASNCTPIERIVQSTKSGLIYCYDDPEDFAEKVSLFLNNRINYKKMAANGRKAVKEKYNWSVDSRILTTIYRNNG